MVFLHKNLNNTSERRFEATAIESSERVERAHLTSAKRETPKRGKAVASQRGRESGDVPAEQSPVSGDSP